MCLRLTKASINHETADDSPSVCWGKAEEEKVVLIPRARCDGGILATFHGVQHWMVEGGGREARGLRKK